MEKRQEPDDQWPHPRIVGGGPKDTGEPSDLETDQVGYPEPPVSLLNMLHVSPRVFILISVLNRGV
jgi:hypothetical protein